MNIKDYIEDYLDSCLNDLKPGQRVWFFNRLKKKLTIQTGEVYLKDYTYLSTTIKFNNGYDEVSVKDVFLTESGAKLGLIKYYDWLIGIRLLKIEKENQRIVKLETERGKLRL